MATHSSTLAWEIKFEKKKKKIPSQVGLYL